MPSWIYEAIDNISSGKKIHGLIMLELVERGLARYSDNTEVQALTSEGMRLYNELNSGKVVG
jgi:hypothetical protein